MSNEKNSNIERKYEEVLKELEKINKRIDKIEKEKERVIKDILIEREGNISKVINEKEEGLLDGINLKNINKGTSTYNYLANDDVLPPYKIEE